MEHLRRLFFLREKDSTLSIILVVTFLFAMIFLLMRGCTRQATSAAPFGITLPSANTPLVDSSLENGNVQFTGNSAAAARVDVFVDGKYIGTTTADSIGQWYLDGEVAESGRHTLSLKSKLLDGTLYESAEFPFDLDLRNTAAGESLDAQGSAVDYLPQLGVEAKQTATVSRPSINTSLSGTTLEPGQLTLSGNGTAGRSLLVFANGAPIGLATVAANGTWQFRTSDLASGSYEFRAEDSTTDGFETAAFTVQVEEPIARPTLALTRDFDQPDILPLSGTGQPNSELDILLNGEQIATVAVDANGNWELDSERQSGILDYSFIARNTVASGGELAESFPGRIIFEREALAVVEPEPTPEPEEPDPEPIAASIELKTPIAVLATLNFDPAGVNGPIIVSGFGEPTGARVKVFFDGTEIGETVVTNAGGWVIEAGIANVAPGNYPITASIVDQDGGELASSRPRQITIPEEISITLGVTKFDFADFTFNDGAASGPLNLLGRGRPTGSQVSIFLAGVKLGEASISDDGSWELGSAVDNLEPGRYELTAQLTDDDDFLLAESSRDLIIPEPTNTLMVGFADSDDAAAQAERELEIAPSVELIFDASWSMTLPPESDAEADRLTADDPDSRIAIARDSLLSVVAGLPEGAPIALRAFGNRAEPLECQTELEVELQPLDRAALSAVIEGIEPQVNANTHIAASLRAIPDDLADAEGAITVILLTDGQETCGGNPANAIAELRDAGIEVIVDVVGFAINNDELKAQFESWAEIGGGQYFDASDSDGLAGALSEAFRPKFRVLDQEGETVAIGAIGGAAVELPIGAYTVEVLGDADASYDVTIGADPVDLEVD